MNDEEKRWDAVLNRYSGDGWDYPDHKEMAWHIVDLESQLAATETKLSATETKLAVVEAERDMFKSIVETYGKVRLLPDMEREVVHVTFSVTYELLKYARDPELVFASTISDVMHKFREITREQDQI